MKENDYDQPTIIHIKETDSTNQYMRSLLQDQDIPEGSIVMADFQTAGKGQPGNSWESEPAANLLFSCILYPHCIPANRQFIISQIAALSVQETLSRYTKHVFVKWPNDIYWKDKKICGMLIENDLTGSHIYASIVGIGINLNQTVFTSPAPNPVSLKQITGDTYDRGTILEQFRRTFYQYYLMILQEKEEEIRQRYFNVLYRNKGYYPYQDDKGMFQAKITGIEPTGHLLLETTEGKERRYAFKEISFVQKESNTDSED